MSQPVHQNVRRRKVFYIPGYDPFPPRRYRELYRREGAEQARLSGYALEQRRGPQPHSWDVTAWIDGARVETRIEVLVWSDIVVASMEATIPATYAQLFRTCWIYLSSGALFRLMRLRRGPVIAALYPVAALLVQAALALALGSAAAAALLPILRSELSTLWSGFDLPLPLATALGSAVVWATLCAFRRYDRWFLAHYLMHDYAFSARWKGANPPALEARLAEFGQMIRDAAAGEWDEVLVVGHSSGAHLAVSALADLVRAGLPPGRVSFLSLGHVVPMVSFLPEAKRLRADLHAMDAQDVVPWIDVTAPGDGCTFALCDPAAVSGVASGAGRWPLVISAAFSETLSPAHRVALRRRWFRLHFQYLCAFDALPGLASDYDYFRITAGPRRLADHFAGRAHSPSRLTAPVNRHTAMAA